MSPSVSPRQSTRSAILLLISSDADSPARLAPERFIVASSERRSHGSGSVVTRSGRDHLHDAAGPVDPDPLSGLQRPEHAGDAADAGDAVLAADDRHVRE